MLHTQFDYTNYRAKIVQLGKPVAHSNADKLEGFIIDGNRVWYGKDLLEEGDIVIYFPLECQINPTILSKLNLFADKTLNEDQTKAGYFDKKGRVRAIRLRGEPSEGFVLSLDNLTYLFGTQFSYEMRKHIDVEFDTIFDTWICKKYIPPAPRNSGTGPKEKIRQKDYLIDGQFRLHYDTENLKKHINEINPEDIITITYKMHGTSAVYANVLVKRNLNWFEKQLSKWIKIVKEEYRHVYSSRSVVKEIVGLRKSDKNSYHGDLWRHVYDEIKDSLLEGITLYGEIVGYQSEGAAIQKGYDYGCFNGEHKFFVYRITYTNPQGKVFEFDWDNLKEYCEKYGLQHVEEFWHGTAMFYTGGMKDGNNVNEWRQELLQSFVRDYLEQGCHICKNKVPGEGVVIRRESRGHKAFKLKSFKFLEGESAALDADEQDLETQESQQ